MGFLFGQQAVETKPKSKSVSTPTNQTWMALAPMIKKRYKTNMTTKEIAAELAYAHYKKQKKDWGKFSEEIG